MSLVPDEIKDAWKDLADQLDETDGGLAVPCKLYLEGGFEDTTVATDAIGDKPKNFLSYGGRANAKSLPGQDIADNDSSNGLKEKEIVKNIEARIYGINRPFLRENLGVQVNKNVWQMNTLKANMVDIMRCKYAVLYSDNNIKRVRVKLLRPPVLYGLGDSVKCKCFWEEI